MYCFRDDIPGHDYLPWPGLLYGCFACSLCALDPLARQRALPFQGASPLHILHVLIATPITNSNLCNVASWLPTCQAFPP